MSVASVINTFLTGTYTVSRRAVGTMTAGRYTSATASTFTIDASIQPISGRDLKLLPEGTKSEDTRVLYTTTELKTRSPDGDPDQVTIAGEAWIVVTVNPWPSHYRVLISRNAVP